MTSRVITPDNVEMVHVARLSTHPRNPRKGNLSIIKESIQQNGFYSTLLVQRSTGYILVGNHRFIAAKMLGIEEVPVLYLDIDDAKALRIAVADNRTSDLGDYDDELLTGALKELADESTGLTGTGYTQSDLDQMLKELGIESGKGPEDYKDTPDAKVDQATALQEKWQVRPGQLWAAGPHRLLCGDCTDPDNYARLMGADKAVLCHSDPPYGMGKEKEGVANDNLYREELDKFQMAWWKQAVQYMVENGSVYIWGNAEDLWRLWHKSGLKESEDKTIRNEITWDKGHGFGMSSDIQRMFSVATERCLFFMLGVQGFNINADHYWDGWDPLLTYLREQVDIMGWGRNEVKELTGVGNYSHWFTKSQWHFIPEEHYIKLQQAAEGKAFLKSYDELKHGHGELKKGFEALKQEFYESRSYFDNTHDKMTDVWQYPRVFNEERFGHSTPKPVAMMRRIILSSAPKGGVVLIPFLGTGPDMVACEQTGRVGRGMDLEPSYIAVVLQRLEDMGLKPELLKE